MASSTCPGPILRLRNGGGGGGGGDSEGWCCSAGDGAELTSKTDGAACYRRGEHQDQKSGGLPVVKREE